MVTLDRARVREFDRRAIEDHGIPGIVLMENAGRNAAVLAHDMFGAGPVAVVCGRGNNGGDGLVIARHLENLGHEVRVLVAAVADRLGGDAAVNLEIVRRSGMPLHFLPDATQEAWRLALEGIVWVVDALLGTGARSVRALPGSMPDSGRFVRLKLAGSTVPGGRVVTDRIGRAARPARLSR